MKKEYQKPKLEFVQCCSELVIAASFQLEINKDKNVETEGQVWSNEESDFNIW